MGHGPFGRLAAEGSTAPAMWVLVLGFTLAACTNAPPTLAELEDQTFESLAEVEMELGCAETVRSFDHPPAGTAEAAAERANAAMGRSATVYAVDRGEVWLIVDAEDRVIGAMDKIPGTILYCFSR